MFTIHGLDTGRGDLARAVLVTLPKWFGQPATLDAYIAAAAAASLPMLAARDANGRDVGFVTLKRHTTLAAEAYVLGVRRGWHRRGCGRALFAAAERTLAADGARYLTVKTLAPEHRDPHYAKTRAFYAAIGFVPLEVLPTLWGKDKPCLLMLKALHG